ncbi:MAG: ABC transporter ATP-binding protein [Aigarchaeota archaeon]|nr:ABC transporter ATP-binding protein [Aigarchaeota archaeon]MDW8021788.1 ABC transporter ATP-binding protein [Nitrososphaerota archaeon]
MDELVGLRGIVKRFPGVVANDHVDFTLRRGEVHALLGENGAGKTTLMNILYGLYKPDEGGIYIKGKRVKLKSPRDAIELGIGMVHQNFRLIEGHTVLENIVLGARDLEFVIDSKRRGEEIRRIAENYGWKIDPEMKIWQLSAGEKQQVELLKILYRGADILILDEPTSVLTPQETRELFRALRRMASEGKGIIFITHKLNEVFEVSDRVTVMRKGRVVVTEKTTETTQEQLANYMVGRPVVFRPEIAEAVSGEEVARVIDLEALSDKGIPALRKVNLTIRSGEIVGIAGVSGNGQVELAEVMAGLRKATGGRVIIAGVDVTNKDPRKIIELGVAYIPPESIKWGIIPDMRIVDNLFLKAYRYHPYSNKLILNWRKIFEDSERLVRDFEVITPNIFNKARSLSGGNIQRLILARELSGIIGGGIPKLIVAAYPTKGLDVGATEFVHKTLLKYKKLGSGILFISEDLEEIMMLSDRIAVMLEGRITGILHRGETNIERLGLLMSKAVAEKR